MTQRPQYVALCGAPESGKTTLAQFLASDFGAELVDDGFCLRAGVSAMFGVPIDHLYDMERKRDVVQVCGKSYTKRQLCGDLGNLLEGFYGDQVIPELTLHSLNRHPKIPFYIFPSVRKNQGLTYRAENNGIVIEVTRDGKIPVNDFDHYDRSLIDYTIENNGTIAELREKGRALLSTWFTPFADYA
jgi:hypothetical protein